MLSLFALFMPCVVISFCIKDICAVIFVGILFIVHTVCQSCEILMSAARNAKTKA